MSNLPSLAALTEEVYAIQRRLNAMQGEATMREGLSLPQGARLRVHLQYAEQAATQAWSVLSIAARDLAAAELEQVNGRA